MKTISLVNTTSVEKNIANYPSLLKHLGWIRKKATRIDAEEFPLAIILSRKSSMSKDLLTQLNETIEKVANVKYFNSVIKRSKNKQEFWDAYSEISIARHCNDRGIYVEFIPQNLGIGDLMAKIDHEKIFFEVKHLVNSKVIEKLENEIRKTVSPFIVGFFISPFISETEAEALLSEIRIALGSKSVMRKKLSYGRFTTYLKTQVSSFPGTPFMGGEIGLIPFEPIRIKISSLIENARSKFHEDNVNLLVLDIQRWTIQLDYVKQALYGENKDGIYYEEANRRVTATFICHSLERTRPSILANPNSLRSDYASQLIQKLSVRA